MPIVRLESNIESRSSHTEAGTPKNTEVNQMFLPAMECSHMKGVAVIFPTSGLQVGQTLWLRTFILTFLDRGDKIACRCCGIEQVTQARGSARRRDSQVQWCHMVWLTQLIYRPDQGIKGCPFGYLLTIFIWTDRNPIRADRTDTWEYGFRFWPLNSV